MASLGSDINTDLCRFVGLYSVDRTVLRNTFSTVSIGHSLSSNKKVIVKTVITSEYQKLKEANFLKRLRHVPGVITYLDTFYYSSTKHILVTEYFGDQNLARFLRQFAPVSENTTNNIFKQLVTVAQICHGLNILHKKIKPTNILVDIRTLQIKLHNFNTACVFDNDDEALTVSLPEDIAPPEYFTANTFTANGHYVWSLGLILYEMLFGKKAFESIQAIIKTPCRASTAKPVDINAVVLLAWMLTKQPMQRIRLNQLSFHPWICKTRI
jgi:serine/threonine protein kinase